MDGGGGILISNYIAVVCSYIDVFQIYLPVEQIYSNSFLCQMAR